MLLWLNEGNNFNFFLSFVSFGVCSTKFFQEVKTNTGLFENGKCYLIYVTSKCLIIQEL